MGRPYGILRVCKRLVLSYRRDDVKQGCCEDLKLRVCIYVDGESVCYPYATAVARWSLGDI